MTVELHRNSLWVKVELVRQPGLVAPVTAESGEVHGLAPAASGSVLPGNPPSCDDTSVEVDGPGGAAAAPGSTAVEVCGPRGSNVPLLSRW